MEKENHWVTEINGAQIPADGDPMVNLMLQGEADEGVSRATGERLEELA